jgi:hypothetical protein
MIMNEELERMWKEAMVAYLKILTQHLPGGSEENNNNKKKPQRGINFVS